MTLYQYGRFSYFTNPETHRLQPVLPYSQIWYASENKGLNHRHQANGFAFGLTALTQTNVTQDVSPLELFTG